MTRDRKTGRGDRSGQEGSKAVTQTTGNGIRKRPSQAKAPANNAGECGHEPEAGARAKRRTEQSSTGQGQRTRGTDRQEQAQEVDIGGQARARQQSKGKEMIARR